MVYRGKLPLGAEAWGETVLHLPAAAPRRWVDIITGNEIETSRAAPANALALSDVLKNFPVALLYRQESAPALQTIDARTDAATFEHGV